MLISPWHKLQALTFTPYCSNEMEQGKLPSAAVWLKTVFCKTKLTGQQHICFPCDL